LFGGLFSITFIFEKEDANKNRKITQKQKQKTKQNTEKEKKIRNDRSPPFPHCQNTEGTPNKLLAEKQKHVKFIEQNKLCYVASQCQNITFQIHRMCSASLQIKKE
jgi:hypothetical protein